ncbi:PAP2-domain-containing protein [Schizopora paradoxa]|uniref:PAP2-domain-containing protein n=1 Tax=Schizopora paradoxa TaxID=27342 RepID=A0A0H2RNS0_9AGAM|nr:PAP2-domain-containing protein [Schizopora paradoxa]
MTWFRMTSPGPSSSNATTRRRYRISLLMSYAPDWVLTIALAAVFFSLDKIDGFKREFSIDDPSLRFPFAEKERVPPLALYLLALAAPLILQPIINLLTVRSFWDFHVGSLGVILSLTLAGAVTQIMKITVGRPRPDVISRCKPPSGVLNPEYGLVTATICTETDIHKLRDGWRSFPSGHSSLSFAGLGFLAFYVAGKMHLFDHRGHTAKAWISLAPLAGAALVAVSRTMDYRHHWQDVLTGSALGLATAYFAYRQYYPPLDHELSERPFAPRLVRGGDALEGGAVEGAGAILPTNVRGDGQTGRLSPLQTGRYTDEPGEGSLRGRGRAVVGVDGESGRNSSEMKNLFNPHHQRTDTESSAGLP